MVELRALPLAVVVGRLLGGIPPVTRSVGGAGRLDAILRRGGCDVAESGVEGARIMGVRRGREGNGKGRARGGGCQFCDA